MVVTVIRAFIIFVTLVIIMRMMGKRQIGEMQPFEFVITLIIADLACIPMADISIPLLYGVVAILGLFLLHQLLSIAERGGTFFKKVLSGKPSVVINLQGVDVKELQKNNMGVSDLIESMRSAGYFSLDDVDYAIFESNGKLSALEKGGGKDNKTSLPLLIVENGKPVKENLCFLGYKKEEIEKFLIGSGSTLKKTEVMTADGKGKVYLKSRGERYKILFLPLRREPW